jgi:hypothetical protein
MGIHSKSMVLAAVPVVAVALAAAGCGGKSVTVAGDRIGCGFNTTGDKACTWYSKYGLQNASYGDLGFAARSKSAQRRAGWYRFLAEAHGDTMKQVVHDDSSAWTWQQLAYGSDPT